MKKQLDRGIRYRRTEDDYPLRINREKIFADAWEDENIPRSYLNQGQGILQDLFINDNGRWDYVYKRVIRKFDRVILFIQINME